MSHTKDKLYVGLDVHKSSIVAAFHLNGRLVTLALAMWRYRLAEGSFPADLGQLVSQYVLKPPTDPFTGQSMKMARTDNGIVVYSVGPDLNDGGGQAFDRKTMKGDVSLRVGR